MMIQFSHAYGEFHMAGHENQPPQAQGNRGKTKMITSDTCLPFFSPCLQWPIARNPIISLGEIQMTNETPETDIAVCLTVSPTVMAQPDRSLSMRGLMAKGFAKKGRAYLKFAI
jgi:hypothetical protein